MTVPELVRLDGGTVSLHDARRKRRWRVDIEPFEIGVTPVTEQQHATLLGEEATASRKPATRASWWDAIRFCNAASARDGLQPAYTVNGHEVTWYPESAGYRLPTEAEWEFACRAGSAGPHYGELSEIAWTSADRVDEPQDVALKQPNDFSLFDTLGNVWEWCWDYLDPARYDDYRVFRGGGFADEAWSVRASVRRGGAPGTRLEDLGFRVARGGFSGGDVVQGWSVRADQDRAGVDGALPVGWTPLRSEPRDTN